MKKVLLNIIGLSYTQTNSGAYAMILGEEDGLRRLPVVIGANEAQSIAINLEGLTPYRPLTHDLFFSLATAFHIELVEVSIVKLEEGVFYSELVCETENSRIKIDSRTSDAVALALRFNCPIYATEEIMRKASVLFNEKTGKFVQDVKKEKKDKDKGLKDFDIEELESQMKIAIEEENYELASVLRDEIRSRKDKGN